MSGVVHWLLFMLYRVEEAYKRIEDPACVVVDASPPPDQVLEEVLLLIKTNATLVKSDTYHNFVWPLGGTAALWNSSLDYTPGRTDFM